MLQVRSAANALCRGGSPNRLTSVQQEEFREFVMGISRELGLAVEPVELRRSVGYDWEAFKLTLPQQRMH